jgi:hypothetical protein
LYTVNRRALAAPTNAGFEYRLRPILAAVIGDGDQSE